MICVCVVNYFFLQSHAEVCLWCSAGRVVVNVCVVARCYCLCCGSWRRVLQGEVLLMSAVDVVTVCCDVLNGLGLPARRADGSVLLGSI